MDDSSRRNGTAISQINVTPFVDVMLVLLVIFMVTAPILQQGVQVNLPEAKAGAVEGEEEPLVVSITEKGSIYLNDNPIQLNELKVKLQAIQQIQKDKEVFLRADRKVAYGVVMRAIATIKEAGIVKLGMITQPPAVGS
ncbi:MAG: protein TolR [Deltaproteobacteria bacterium]|nr:protein TolR [Deltaproteobacteria bacterium]